MRSGLGLRGRLGGARRYAWCVAGGRRPWLGLDHTLAHRKLRVRKMPREAHRPVAKDLLTRLLEESWYPPAHLGGTSERPAWCASWARAARLIEGALGTPDARVRTVGGRVAYFFAACREVAAICAKEK